MEFIYGTEKDMEVLKTISPTSEELSGFKVIESKNPDQIITDQFFIVRKIREKKDSLGNFYKWYEIDKHYRVIDKTVQLKEQINRSSANIDYLSMMTGIDLPTIVEE